MSASRMSRLLRGAALAAAALLLSACERPPIEYVQSGYRGTAMGQVYNPRHLATQIDVNAAPAALPPAGEGTPAAKTIYQNVPVLGDLSAAEFTRLMVAITGWVAPQSEGCGYCHNLANLASDEKYTKVVSRRMIQMTQYINSTWKQHVASSGNPGAGVTCHTCHRGKQVPANVWVAENPPGPQGGSLGNRVGQNNPVRAVAWSTLPQDPFTPYFLGTGESIRVAATTALPAGYVDTINRTEKTYGLMMHMSDGLGVNCTFCHNSRSFGDWQNSTPQRVTAWHGIRMVREINNGYLAPLASALPPHRKGPLGDAPKANCATCHQGAYKPLYGTPVLADYATALGGTPPATAAAAPRKAGRS